MSEQQATGVRRLDEAQATLEEQTPPSPQGGDDQGAAMRKDSRRAGRLGAETLCCHWASWAPGLQGTPWDPTRSTCGAGAASAGEEAGPVMGPPQAWCFNTPTGLQGHSPRQEGQHTALTVQLQHRPRAWRDIGWRDCVWMPSCSAWFSFGILQMRMRT